MSDGFNEAVLTALARLESRFESFDARLESFDARLESFGARLESVESRQEEIERRNAERHAELMGNNRRTEAKVDRLEVRVDRLHDDMMDVKMRLTQIDHTISHWGGTVAVQSGRQDRFETRIELIEKRLELRDDQPPPA